MEEEFTSYLVLRSAKAGFCIEETRWQASIEGCFDDVKVLVREKENIGNTDRTMLFPVVVWTVVRTSTKEAEEIWRDQLFRGL